MCAQFRLCCPNGVSATSGQQDKTTESAFKNEIFDLNDSILGFDVNASDLLFYWSFSQRITSITVTLFWTSFKFNICKSAFLFFLYSSIRFLNDSLELVNNPGEWIFFYAYEISELNNTRNALHSGGFAYQCACCQSIQIAKKRVENGTRRSDWLIFSLKLMVSNWFHVKIEFHGTFRNSLKSKWFLTKRTSPETCKLIPNLFLDFHTDLISDEKLRKIFFLFCTIIYREW